MCIKVQYRCNQCHADLAPFCTIKECPNSAPYRTTSEFNTYAPLPVNEHTKAKSKAKAANGYCSQQHVEWEGVPKCWECLFREMTIGGESSPVPGTGTASVNRGPGLVKRGR